MKPAGSKEIKEALTRLPSDELMNIILRLARLKKENKELLTYLLFEAQNEQEYVNEIKRFIESEMDTVNKKVIYITRKNIRRIIRTANRLVKYSGNPESVIQVNIHLLQEMERAQIPFEKSVALEKMREQIKKNIHKAMEGLHEDLVHDYLRIMRK